MVDLVDKIVTARLPAHPPRKGSGSSSASHSDSRGSDWKEALALLKAPKPADPQASEPEAGGDNSHSKPDKPDIGGNSPQDQKSGEALNVPKSAQELMKLTKKKLSEMCQEKQLAYSGNKETLVQRLTKQTGRKELKADEIKKQLEAARNKLRGTTKSVLHVADRRQSQRGKMLKLPDRKPRSNSSAQQQTLLVTFPDLLQRTDREEAITRFAEMLQRQPADCTDESDTPRSETLEVVFSSVGNGHFEQSRRVPIQLGCDEQTMVRGLMAHCGPRFHMVGECGDRGEGAERHTKTCSLLGSVLTQLVRPAREVAALEMLGRNGETTETTAECWQGKLEEQRTKKLPQLEQEVAGRLTGLGWDMLLDHAPEPLKGSCACHAQETTVDRKKKKRELASCASGQCVCRKAGRLCGSECSCAADCCRNRTETEAADKKKRDKQSKIKKRNAWIPQQTDSEPVRPAADGEECPRHSLNSDALWKEVIKPIFTLEKLRLAK